MYYTVKGDIATGKKYSQGNDLVSYFSSGRFSPGQDNTYVKVRCIPDETDDDALRSLNYKWELKCSHRRLNMPLTANTCLQKSCPDTFISATGQSSTAS